MLRLAAPAGGACRRASRSPSSHARQAARSVQFRGWRTADDGGGGGRRGNDASAADQREMEPQRGGVPLVGDQCRMPGWRRPCIIASPPPLRSPSAPPPLCSASPPSSVSPPPHLGIAADERRPQQLCDPRRRRRRAAAQLHCQAGKDEGQAGGSAAAGEGGDGRGRRGQSQLLLAGRAGGTLCAAQNTSGLRSRRRCARSGCAACMHAHPAAAASATTAAPFISLRPQQGKQGLRQGRRQGEAGRGRERQGGAGRGGRVQGTVEPLERLTKL